MEVGPGAGFVAQHGPFADAVDKFTPIGFEPITRAAVRRPSPLWLRGLRVPVPLRGEHFDARIRSVRQLLRAVLIPPHHRANMMIPDKTTLLRIIDVAWVAGGIAFRKQTEGMWPTEVAQQVEVIYEPSTATMGFA